MKRNGYVFEPVDLPVQRSSVPVFIDQTPAKNLRREDGWLMNDISLLVKAHSVQEQDAVLRRMQQLDLGNTDSSISDRQLIDSCVKVGSPAEQLARLDWLAATRPDLFNPVAVETTPDPVETTDDSSPAAESVE